MVHMCTSIKWFSIEKIWCGSYLADTGSKILRASVKTGEVELCLTCWLTNDSTAQQPHLNRKYPCDFTLLLYGQLLDSVSALNIATCGES